MLDLKRIEPRERSQAGNQLLFQLTANQLAVDDRGEHRTRSDEQRPVAVEDLAPRCRSAGEVDLVSLGGPLVNGRLGDLNLPETEGEQREQRQEDGAEDPDSPSDRHIFQLASRLAASSALAAGNTAAARIIV